MRLIDADKLMRDVEEYDLSDGKFQHWIEIQPTIEPAQRWIPCSERLPEKDGIYLVTTKGKRQVQVHVFNHDGNSEEYWTRSNVAWTPLPEPWREEHE